MVSSTRWTKRVLWRLVPLKDLLEFTLNSYMMISLAVERIFMGKKTDFMIMGITIPINLFCMVTVLMTFAEFELTEIATGSSLQSN